MATLFNDTIFAKKALQAFRAKLAPLSAFCTDFSEATRSVGDAIIVPRYSAATSTTYASANNSNFPYEGSDGTAAAITVNLNQHQVVPLDLSDLELANSSAAQMDKLAVQQGHALAKKVIQNVWSQITTGAFGAAVVTTSVANWGTSLTAVKTMRSTLASRNVPDENRSLFVNVDIYDALLNLTVVQQADSFGTSRAIKDGALMRLLGFDLYESNIIPLNGISLGAFAIHADALAVAMRYLNPGDTSAYAAAMALSDESGITMGYRRHYNPGKGKWFINFECLFGFATGLSLGCAVATIP